jgi:hypothetical protein
LKTSVEELELIFQMIQFDDWTEEMEDEIPAPTKTDPTNEQHPTSSSSRLLVQDNDEEDIDLDVSYSDNVRTSWFLFNCEQFQ